jgi:hypothetical protein
VLRRISGPGREEGIGRQRNVGLSSEELRNLYSAPNANALIKWRKNIYQGQIRKAHILVGTTEAKTRLKG